MPENTSKPTDSVEVRGYITDPKRAGFQVLTNYECIYWRALVGNDAWGLYEVLRSFCHEGATACFPSIRFLKDILGFKDKRALIGRKKIVQGRKYEYPGIIDILQEHDLIVAEIIGEKPKTSYVFHVNITPGLLADAQVRKLPALLREKHQALMERIAGEISGLKSKRRAKRFANPGGADTGETGQTQAQSAESEPRDDEQGNFPPGEGEIPNRGVGNSHPNITQQAKPKEHHQPEPENIKYARDLTAQPDAPEPDDEMVKLLLSFDVTRASAEKLANSYSKQRILRQISNLEHRTERGEPIRGNRGGKLRTMIENDWPFLGDYKSPEQLAREEQRKAERAAQAEAERDRERADMEISRRERKQLLQAIRTAMGASDGDCDAWESRKKRLKHSLQAQEYMFFVGSYLLGIEQTTAVIGVHSAFIQERLENGNLYARLKQELSDMVDEVDDVKVVILNEALASVRGNEES